MKHKEGLWHEHVYFYQEDLVKDPNIIFANITLHKVSSLSRLPDSLSKRHNKRLLSLDKVVVANTKSE